MDGNTTEAPDWWADLHGEILDCLAESGALAPAEVGRRLGMSEAAVTSCLAMLAQERRVRICLVERS